MRHTVLWTDAPALPLPLQVGPSTRPSKERGRSLSVWIVLGGASPRSPFPSDDGLPADEDPALVFSRVDGRHAAPRAAPENAHSAAWLQHKTNG